MLSLLIALGLFSPNLQPGCGPDGPAAGGTSAAAAPVALQGTTPNTMGTEALAHRGAPFTVAGDAITLDAVADAPEKFTGKTVKVNGKIATVCRMKGCWMTIAGTKPTSKARVTFKDYGFFAPKDADGAMATVEGTVEVKQVPEDERQHLADDAKASIDTIPKVELRLVATAIEVRRVGH